MINLLILDRNNRHTIIDRPLIDLQIISNNLELNTFTLSIEI
jgi:hypothetical protein